eukprot:CAMPEP_0201583480 /NCGR_PEP_ID=MMETSP0190_2-20130828/98928_1 /ASSEMBLY_ACC=CAM_ASM_000263 /TAXON_ID=37353 /ORGANISM="Rosalina sp." /LENGTH=84 /DNA_ID=CAMNT_0048025421 /DNA_START=21 /DNA_END=272 /DNA_ORIENTATION=-
MDVDDINDFLEQTPNQHNNNNLNNNNKNNWTVGNIENLNFGVNPNNNFNQNNNTQNDDNINYILCPMCQTPIKPNAVNLCIQCL